MLVLASRALDKRKTLGDLGRALHDLVGQLPDALRLQGAKAVRVALENRGDDEKERGQKLKAAAPDLFSDGAAPSLQVSMLVRMLATIGL